MFEFDRYLLDCVIQQTEVCMCYDRNSFVYMNGNPYFTVYSIKIKMFVFKRFFL